MDRDRRSGRCGGKCGVTIEQKVTISRLFPMFACALPVITLRTIDGRLPPAEETPHENPIKFIALKALNSPETFTTRTQSSLTCGGSGRLYLAPVW